MQKRLWIFCGIAAILSAIAFIPGILVIATFLAVIPAFILGFAPDALMVGVALLILDSLSPPAKGSRMAAIALAMVGLLVTLVVAAAVFNRPLQQEVEAVTKDDHDSTETLPATRNLAIQFVTNGRARRKPKPARHGAVAQPDDDDETAGPVPVPARKQFCERLCLHLLFNGLADSVIVSSVPAAEGLATPDLAEIGMRFHLGRQRGCRQPDIKTDETAGPPFRLFEPGEEPGFAGEISARMIRQGCVLGEPARLSDAEIIVQENALILPATGAPGNISNAANIVHPVFAPDRASRLTIYRVQGGVVAEVFRQTEVQAYPLLPVLLLGPVFTGEGGIGISEGFFRRRRIYSEYKLRDVLKSKLGLDVVSISK